MTKQRKIISIPYQIRNLDYFDHIVRDKHILQLLNRSKIDKLSVRRRQAL